MVNVNNKIYLLTLNIIDLYLTQQLVEHFKTNDDEKIFGPYCYRRLYGSCSCVLRFFKRRTL
jgi:hypothetical protein